MTKKKEAGKWIGASLWIIFGLTFIFGGFRLGNLFERSLAEGFIFLLLIVLINAEIFYLLFCFYGNVDEDDWSVAKSISIILGLISGAFSMVCYEIFNFFKTININWVVIFSYAGIIIGIIGIIVLYFYGNYKLMKKIREKYK